jgi:type IV secretion system protein VirD4
MIRDLIAVALVLVLTILISAWLFHRCVFSKRARAANRARAMRWLVRLRRRPGPGYAGMTEMVFRWSRMAAVSHGRQARPGLSFWARLRCSTTDYAISLGRAQCFRRVYARMVDCCLYLAPQRTGKTTALARRILAHPGPVLTTTTRVDLHRDTAWRRMCGTRPGLTGRLLGRRGRAQGRVHVFNPEGVGNVASSLRFDLLGPCRDLMTAYRIASWLSGQSRELGNLEWFESKGDIAMMGLLFAAAVGGRSLADVYQWSQRRGFEDALRILAGHPDTGPEIIAAVSQVMEDNRTAASIRSTMDHSLKWAIIPRLAEAVEPLPGQELDAAEFVMSTDTLYMIASGDDDNPITPLFRCLASYVHHVAGLEGSKTKPGRLDPPLLMALDEVTQVCPVNLPAMLADSAGKGILIAAVCHSFSQLEDRWGEKGAKTIWATCGTKIFLPAISDDDTLEKASRLCGTTAVIIGETTTMVPVAPPEFIRGLPDYWALVIRMNLSPCVVKTGKLPRGRVPAPARSRASVPALTPGPEPEPLTEGLDSPVPAAMNGHGGAAGPAREGRYR